MPNSVHLQLCFSNSYDPVKSGHLNNPVPNTIQSPGHSPQLMFSQSSINNPTMNFGWGVTMKNCMKLIAGLTIMI